MTSVANVAKGVGDEMAKHPRIAHDVVIGLEAISTAWLGIKAVGIVETILTPIVGGLATMVAGEEAATAATSTLAGALGALGPIAAGLAAAQLIGKPADQWIANDVPGGDTVEQNANPEAWGQWLADQIWGLVKVGRSSITCSAAMRVVAHSARPGRKATTVPCFGAPTASTFYPILRCRRWAAIRGCTRFAGT